VSSQIDTCVVQVYKIITNKWTLVCINLIWKCYCPSSVRTINEWFILNGALPCAQTHVNI